MHLHGFLLGIMSAKWNRCIKGYMNADDGLGTLSGTTAMLGRDPRKSGTKHGWCPVFSQHLAASGKGGNLGIFLCYVFCSLYSVL